MQLNATIPLFEGGGRYSRKRRANQELQELSLTRDATRQRVEQRVRSTLYGANASFIGIELARVAEEEAARQNLELVQDAYAQGVVDILRLLDAQNQALAARLASANAIYDYLFDFMAVQRSVGRFDFFRSPQERQDFLNRLRSFVASRP